LELFSITMGGDTNQEFDDEAVSGPVVDRRTTIGLLGAAGMHGLAGYAEKLEASEAEVAATQDQPQTGGTLVAGWSGGSGVRKLDPPTINLGQEFQVAANVFSGLVTLEEDLTVRGDLAEDWTISEGGSRFTFQLREGVTFHDGTEFTAEDVRYTINRTIENETPAAAKLDTLQPVDEGGVVVQGDYTVELNWERPMSPALIYLTRGPGRAATIVNQEAIEEMGQEEYSQMPVGTGAFEVAEHEVGSRIVLEAYDDYFQTDENGNQLPYLDRIEIRLLSEPATLSNAIRGGDLDFINIVPLDIVSRIEQSSEVEILRAPGVNWIGLAMNSEREPFSSRQARRGIAKVIDNESYVEQGLFGNALPDTGPINKATAWVWREDKPTDQEYAPEEGQQLLEESGASGASFSLLATPDTLRESRVLRQQLNNAGLDVEVDQVTNATYNERFFNNQDYDATVTGSVGDPDPDQSLWNFYRKPDQGGVWNWTFYDNDEVHEMLGEQRRQLDRDGRAQTLQDLEDQLIADVPHAYIYHRDDIAAAVNRVNGFVHIPFIRNFHTTWVEQ
jgi:peptide/nickel transport system substrate-binding protein